MSVCAVHFKACDVRPEYRTLFRQYWKNFAFFWCKLQFCRSKMEDFSNFSQKNQVHRSTIAIFRFSHWFVPSIKRSKHCRAVERAPPLASCPLVPTALHKNPSTLISSHYRTMCRKFQPFAYLDCRAVQWWSVGR